MQFNSYGNVWQSASLNMADLLASEQADAVKLRRILELGYFSQFTSYPDSRFNDALVTWLDEYLTRNFNFEIGNLPENLFELDIVPVSTIVDRGGRKLSPDLLRYVIYVKQLNKVWSSCSHKKINVLEIGAGYGGLARTLHCFQPGTKFWLTDIPESLRCAEIYLRTAFPDAKITWGQSGDSNFEQDADFCLVPLEDAQQVLCGKHFDLAINIWSFGEMSNTFVKFWLTLLQKDCDVDWLFTINSFMAPVTPESFERTKIGDWLFGLDDHWMIDTFEIDPMVHRCPLIINFPKGIGVLAKRITDESSLKLMKGEAALEANKVMLEDWVRIAMDDCVTMSPDRPERMFNLSEINLNASLVSSRRLLSLTDYVGHFNISSDKEGSFFRLWNNYRMNNSEKSAAFLIAYLAMVNKTNLEHRCTKEELLILKRLSLLPLHLEYITFNAELNKSKILHNDAWLTSQEACDLALEFKKNYNYEAAETLWIKVAAVNPSHGDCWCQIGLLNELKGCLGLAAVCAAHSVRLGCDYYSQAAASLKKSFERSIAVTPKSVTSYLFGLLSGNNINGPIVPADVAISAVDSLCIEYLAGYEMKSLEGLSQFYSDHSNDSMAQAFKHAAIYYA